MRAGNEEHYVSVFIPNEASADPAVLAGGVGAVLTPTHAEVTLTDGKRWRTRLSLQLGGTRKEDGWRAEQTG